MWDADPFGYTPSGAETGMSVMMRAIPVLQEIVTTHPNQAVLVVSHKATNRIIVGHYLGIEQRGFRDRLDQKPACLNILDFHDPVRARLMLLNDVSHYEAEPEREHIHLSGWWAESKAETSFTTKARLSKEGRQAQRNFSNSWRSLRLSGKEED